MAGEKLPAGKLPADLLRVLLKSFPITDPAVIVSGAIGEDAAVIDTGGAELLVAKTDPVTFAGKDMVRYLLAVNGNDLATTGAEPRWLLVTALLPEMVTVEEASALFDSLRSECTRAGLTLVGGHTEITIGLLRPILIGCLLGTVPRDRLIRTAGARPGDAILLVGGIAVEGTAILAREHAAKLRAAGVSPIAVARTADWLDDPGISILAFARGLMDSGGVHAMHDPTEGGLATALYEMSEAAGVGMRIGRDAIPVLPECAAICAVLKLDPLGLLASGALLAAMDPAAVPAAIDRLHATGTPAARIGEIVPAAEGVRFSDGVPVPTFARDELASYLERRGPRGTLRPSEVK